jgi:hypothetical protein
MGVPGKWRGPGMWFEIGGFKDPGHYARPVNSLLGLMRIPRFISWVMLQSSRPPKPIAVRLEAAGVPRCGMDAVVRV